MKPANSGPGPSAANVNGSRKDHTATALPLCGKPQKKLSKVSQVKVCACACPQVPANSDFDIRVMDPVRQGEGGRGECYVQALPLLVCPRASSLSGSILLPNIGFWQ